MAGLSKIPFRFLYGGLKPVLWLVIFTFLLADLFNKGRRSLFEFGWLQIYEEGLKQGFLFQ